MNVVKQNPPQKRKKKLKEPEVFSPQAKKVIKACSILGLTIFTSLALYSYHPTDASFIYNSTVPGITLNWLGALGSYWASLLLYLFGGAAWLFPLLLLYLLRMNLFRLAWKREFDRVAAFAFFIGISSGILNFYRIDIYRGIYPGGLLGSVFSQLGTVFFAEAHKELFLFMLTWAAWVIITRFSFIVYLYPLRNALKKIPVRKAFNALGTALWNMVLTLKASIPRARYYEGIEEVEDEVQPATKFEELLSEYSDAQPEEDSVVLYKAEEKSILPEGQTTEQPMELPEGGVQPVTAAPPKKEEVYHLPSMDLFATVKDAGEDAQMRKISEERAKALEEKLERFGIKGKIVSITRGPVVTLFEYQPSIDTRIATIVAREDDLALALQALSLRILAPIPGRSVVGFEVAHANRKPVLYSAILKSKAYKNFKGQLPMILGKDTLGHNVVIDLAAMPHLLVAGSTGAGKSVGLHSMITSILCCRTPDEVKFILIDPKRLEFAAYADIAHLVFPIVTDPRRAISVLKWAVENMEDRYAMMAEDGVRNAAEYNKKRKPTDEDYMPILVIVIDELADLMMTAGKEVEFLIARLAQMARAASIHMITATQRPSVDVITGLIKVNFPSRIAYKVTSKVDSRTILDMSGAEKLLGKGDMLFLDTKGAVQRVHGAYITDNEISTVIGHIKAERKVVYKEISSIKKIETKEDTDDLFEDVLEYINKKDEISISLLQRVFRVGYNRSARIIDQLEATGHIHPADGGKMRKVAKEQ